MHHCITQATTETKSTFCDYIFLRLSNGKEHPFDWWPVSYSQFVIHFLREKVNQLELCIQADWKWSHPYWLLMVPTADLNDYVFILIVHSYYLLIE